MGVLIKQPPGPRGDALSVYLTEVWGLSPLSREAELEFGRVIKEGRRELSCALLSCPDIIQALGDVRRSIADELEVAPFGLADDQRAETCVKLDELAEAAVGLNDARRLARSHHGTGDAGIAEAEEQCLAALQATEIGYDLAEHLAETLNDRIVASTASRRQVGRNRARAVTTELQAIQAAVSRARATIRSAREELVRAHLRMVVAAARRFANRGVPLPDLVQEGNIGLLIAADRFDYTLGYRFNTYAMWWIRAQLRAAVARHGRTIRVPVRRLQAVSRVLKAARQLAQHHGREPTAEELAKSVEMDSDEVRRLLDIPAEPVRLEALDVGDATPTAERLEDPNAPNPLEELIGSTDRRIAVELLAGLSEREANIIRLRFGIRHEPHTLEQIGRKLGVTRERIRQIEARALRKLRALSESHSTATLATVQ